MSPIFQTAVDYADLEQLAEREILRALEELPEDLRVLAEQLPVICAGTPEDVEEVDDMELLGLFCGAPYDESLEEFSVEPVQIFLFLENIWDFAEGEVQPFLEEVRITYLHELGHFFGWDEDDLAARGLA